jgi:hypothetical protein
VITPATVTRTPTSARGADRRGLHGDVFTTVDPEEHDDEEEEDHDGPGVDDDLHGREEVSVHLDESQRDAKEGHRSG